MSHDYILTLSCPDRVGIVATVTQFIANLKGSITEASQHGDPVSQWFFMRVAIDASTLSCELDDFRLQFETIAAKFKMQWSIVDTAIKPRLLILVSKQGHCLADLLYRWHSHELEVDIAAVISNHDDLRHLVEPYGIDYHHLPMDAKHKAAAFEQIATLYEDTHANVMVMARFMQILPPALCERYFGHIINIHHSFLPSFSGANPYRNAYDYGVKLIGATCHYVTKELDAGPIIDQDVMRVSHAHSIKDLERLGKDVEKMVLARGVRYHCQHRILIHGNKTVVFES